MMRMCPRDFLVHAPTRFLEAEYSLSYTSILRMEKEALAHDIPKPKLDGVEGIRRCTMQHPSYPPWQLMKGKRYVLLRGREKIDGDAKETLR